MRTRLPDHDMRHATQRAGARCTGGQYSLCRALLGIGIAVAAAGFAVQAADPRWRAAGSGAGLPPAATVTLAVAASAVALLFAAGIADRLAAAVLIALGAALATGGALAIGRGTLLVGALLVAHLFVPPAPWGSFAARGRPDPGAGWSLPRGVHAAIGIALGAVAAGGAALRLARPDGIDGPASRAAFALEIALVAAALAPRLRAPAWCGLAILEVSRLALLHAGGDAVALCAGLLFAFDPAWVPPRPRMLAGAGAPGPAAPGAQDRGAGADVRWTLFYDGDCGLCHRAVRFVVAEDATDGWRFRFAPLGGALFAAALDADTRAGLPDSLVLLPPGGRPLVRFRATRGILLGLGGWWGIVGRLAAVVPVAAGDAAYDLVARLRHRLFAAPKAACPIPPGALRSRFILD